MKPGVYREMSFADYRAIYAVNVSSLLPLLVSPWHYLHRLETPQADTAAMALGRAAHTMVLEPHKFEDEYLTYDGTSRKNKGYVALAQSSNSTVLLSREVAKVRKIAEAVAASSTAQQQLDNEGDAEVTIVWEWGGSGGTLCKGRIDFAHEESLVDLKTTRNIDPRSFSRDCGTLHYHVKAAWYREGWRACTGMTLPFHIVAVENSCPFDVAVFNLSQRAMQSGLVTCERLLTQLREARRTKRYPGVSSGKVLELDVPDWAMESEAADLITIGGKPLFGNIGES